MVLKVGVWRELLPSGYLKALFDCDANSSLDSRTVFDIVLDEFNGKLSGDDVRELVRVCYCVDLNDPEAATGAGRVARSITLARTMCPQIPDYYVTRVCTQRPDEHAMSAAAIAAAAYETDLDSEMEGATV